MMAGLRTMLWSPKDEALEVVGRMKGLKAGKARLLELVRRLG